MGKNVKRLFGEFKPEHYDLQITPNTKALSFEGTVTISGQKVNRPNQRLTFHQHGLKITSAQVTKHDKKGDIAVEIDRINHHARYDEVRLHAAHMLYPGKYTVTMTFTGSIQESMHGIYRSSYKIDKKQQEIISTQFESHHAREAFPCIDEPEAKATFDLTLAIPDTLVAVGNTPVKSQHKKDGLLSVTFETSPKMSTYLLAFVYGDLQHKTTTTKSGVQVGVWATKAHKPNQLDFGLEVARRGIEFFDEYYGVPYPLAKCDHVAIPDFSSAAMENWGLITYREPYLLVDPKTTPKSVKETVAIVINHELSHQWFGNLVTMKWWDDLWLNESFANVMEYVATDALFPEWNVWNNFMTREALAAQRRDAIAGVQAVKTAVHHPDEISTLFDPSIVYAKGGRLLNMLMHYIGVDAFRKGLKQYFTTHAYGNTVGDDLWAALSKASGKNIAAFMNPWLTRSGYPVVRVEQHKKQANISQQHFLLDAKKADKHRVWPVPLLGTDPGLPALLRTAKTAAKLESEAYLRLNQGAVGHYLVHYAQPEHAEAIAALVSSQGLGLPERLMLLSDSSSLGRGGVQSFAETLRLLEHYESEDAEPVWDIIALVLADARRFLDVDAGLKPKLQALIRRLIQPQFERLGWEEQPNESIQDIKLRATIIGLGVYARHKEIVARALELFEQYKTDEHAVPAELRSIVFGAAVRNETPGAFEYLLKLDETTSNVDLKQEVMEALPLTEDKSHIKLLLDRLKDSKKVRLHDLDHWIFFLLRNKHSRPLAWHWLKQNWDWIEKTLDGDKNYDNFPRYTAAAFGTRQLLEEYKTFFSPLANQPALTRNIEMGIEEITNRVEWLERDLTAVQSFFKN